MPWLRKAKVRLQVKSGCAVTSKAGICSIAVPGEAGGGSHAWNYVKDGSSYRYIDVTWDDPVQDQGAKAAVK